MSVSVTRDRRPRMPLKVTYKVIITNPDGSIAQVIEGKNDDPFTYELCLAVLWVIDCSKPVHRFP